MKKINKFKFIWLGLANALIWSTALANNDAAEWIRQMSLAMENLTYEGTFVYLHDGEIETLRVVHDVSSKGERERLSSLNGEARVIIRDSDNVTCIWPGSKSVIVSESKPRTPFPQFSTVNYAKFARYYEFAVAGDDRVAGLDTKVVSMMPIDTYRYGFKLWIDKKSHLLLRSKLLDNDQQVVEQIMFTNVQFPDTASADNFDKRPKNNGYTWHTVKNSLPGVVVDDKSYITFKKLPSGFIKVSESLRPMPMEKNPVRHAIVSDGVSSISVYVEYTEQIGHEELKGVSSIGAVHAYGKTIDKAFITVVGEVPMVTVKMIGDSIVLNH